MFRTIIHRHMRFCFYSVFIIATTVAFGCFITLVRTIRQSALESGAIANIKMRIGTFFSK